MYKNKKEKKMNNEEKNIHENNAEVEKASFGTWWKKLATGTKAGIIAALALVVIVPIVLVIALSGSGDNGGSTGGNGDNGGDGKVNYTVTVVDEDGAAIKGVKLTFITSKMEMPGTTDADGKAAYKTADPVKVKVTSIPTGYTYAKLGAEQSFGSDGTLTVTLEKLPDFVIRVVDEDGNAIAGVAVQMCDEAGSCRMPRSTDENGCASYPYEEGSFHAQLTELPDGYTVDDAGKYYDFEDNIATIVLTKI